MANRNSRPPPSWRRPPNYEEAADASEQGSDTLLASTTSRPSNGKLRTDQSLESHLAYRAPPHDPTKGLPVNTDGARDGLQTARGRAAKAGVVSMDQTSCQNSFSCVGKFKRTGSRSSAQTGLLTVQPKTAAASPGQGRHQNLAIARPRLPMFGQNGHWPDCPT